MAGLAARSEVRALNPALGSVDELKNVILHSVLEARGFTALVDTPGEVAGNRNDTRVSILHLGISGPQFWRVVMCVSDSGFDEANATVNEVWNAIDQLKFL